MYMIKTRKKIEYTNFLQAIKAYLTGKLMD